jgi:acyl carrier protein
MNKTIIEEEVKHLLIDALELEDISPKDIASEEPLFGDGLGLDSIDVLEIEIALKKKYGISIDASYKKNFYSISTLADLVIEFSQQNKMEQNGNV